MKLTMSKIVIAVFILIVVLTAGLLLLAFKSGSVNKLETEETVQNQETSSKNQNNNSLEFEQQDSSEAASSGALSEIDIPENLPPGLNIKKLESVGGKTGEVIFIAVNDEGKLSVAIEGKLEAPAAGRAYYAWLANANQNNYKLGKIELRNNSYIFSDTLEGDYSNYKKIIISEELNDDGNIESIVFEGNI